MAVSPHFCLISPPTPQKIGCKVPKNRFFLCEISLTCATIRVLLTLREKVMKITVSTAVAAMALASPALAWEGQKVACYDKHWVPATYSTTKVLEYPAKHKWEHVDGQMVKMYYPPIYMEKTHQESEGHYVLRKAPCN